MDIKQYFLGFLVIEVCFNDVVYTNKRELKVVRQSINMQ